MVVYSCQRNDIEKEREKFAMEKEKMEIEHRHQLELREKEFEAQLSSSLISEALKLPEIRQEISKGIKSGRK